MKDHKRHPAAHSGASVATLAGVTSQFPRSPAATHDMKVATPTRHPAPGCSPKHVGTVKAAAKK